MALTEDQKSAANAPSSVAVTAGAGTGKTFMLAARYLFHLRDQRLSPLEVVAVTFTERAANELRSRIRRTVASDYPGDSGLDETTAELEAAQIGTIHSLCARICHDHPEESGAPIGFGILDEAEGAIAAAAWFDEALESMPDEIYDEIPFSVLRAVLSGMLREPAAAGRALTAGPEEWRPLADAARAEVLGEIACDPNWAGDVSVLKAHRGNDDDLKEQARRTVLENGTGMGDDAASTIMALDAISRVGLRGGSAKKWPAGGLEAVNEALKRMKAAAKDYHARLSALEPSEADEQQAALMPALLKAFNHLRSHIESRKHRARLLDFADLEEYALRALGHEHVRNHYRKRWRAFLVDEFQDTNPIQSEILGRLTESAQLTIVGDEKQSIYGFRRADVTVFRRFTAGIVDAGGLEMALSLSFRAHRELVTGFNLIFEPVLGELHSPLKAHRAEAPHPGPHITAFFVAADKSIPKFTRQRAEAHRIAEMIAGMIREGMPVHDREAGGSRPACPGDFAILSRAWEPLDSYQDALNSAGVPSAHMGGGSLFETRTARDAIAMLRFLADHNDDLALAAVLRSPFLAISDRVLHQASLDRKANTSWWSHINSVEIAEFRDALRVLGQLVNDAPTLAPSRLLQLADRLTGYSAVISSLPNGARRLADWRGIMDLIMSLERGCGKDLFILNRRISHMVDAAVEFPRPLIEARDAVSLMTIHAAKGLEWPVVIVPDLSRKIRQETSPALFAPSLGVALRMADADGRPVKTVLYSLIETDRRHRDLAEARRLLYVAMTRARDRVILSAADDNGGMLNMLLPGLENAGIAVESLDLDPNR